MKTLSQTDRVGLLLASGYTKKEIALKTGKSLHTVSKETDVLYKRTGSHNLADITRHMISRYTGIPSEDILIHALHDITVGLAVAFTTWVAFQPEVAEKINTALSTIANFLNNIL